MKKEYIGLIAVFTVVIIVLGTFMLYNAWPLITGKSIVLATMPVDPFDPFRGQYLSIRYEISSLKGVGFEDGDTIYVSLKEEDGIWRYDSVSHTKPAGDFIKGKVTSVERGNIRVEYGIEQFFFEGRANLPTRNITVEVKVAPSGRARLVQMLHNGEPMDIEYGNFSIKS